eukprot:scaffold79889_cov19-Tisochrysis_lutea.AAC.1
MAVRQTFWLAKEGKREHAVGTSTAPAPIPKLTYLLNLKNAPKSHMHTKQTCLCQFQNRLQ